MEETATAVLPAPPAETPSPDPNLDLSTYTPEQRREWKESGKMPEASTQAASDTAADSQPGAAKGEPARDATGKFTQAQQNQGDWKPEKAETARRFRELLDKNAALDTELRTLRNGSNGAPPPPAGKPAEAGKPAPAERVRPARPQWEGFDGTYEQYEVKLDQYHEELADWKADQRLAAYKQENATRAQQLHQEAQQNSEQRHFAGIAAEVTKEHADYPKVSKAAYEVIAQAPERVQSAFGYLADIGAEGARVLYRLGENDGALALELISMSPADVVTQLALLRHELRNGSTAPTTETKPVTPKFTRAPPLSPRVGGGGTPPVDAADAALAAGDVRAYKRIMNERDAAVHR